MRQGTYIDMVQLPASRHFTLHELGEGIYAAIHKPGGWAQSNAGIIDIGDRTLVFDAFLSPRASQDLLAAAQALTGRPAIDGVTTNGSNSAPSTDQRGVARPQGQRYDIGAFELVDNTPPDTSINSQNPATTPTNSTSMIFTFSGADTGSGVKSFECDLDGGGFAACLSPRSYASLADGSHTFHVRAIDFVGNVDASPASHTWTVDTTPPTVVSSVRADPNPTSAASVNFTVTFSESVTGVDVSDFSLTKTGVSGATVSGVSGSGSVYTVTVNTAPLVSGVGTIRLDVVDDNSIVDAALNSLGGVGLGDGSYTSGETYDVRFYRAYIPLVLKY